MFDQPSIGGSPQLFSPQWGTAMMGGSVGQPFGQQQNPFGGYQATWSGMNPYQFGGGLGGWGGQQGGWGQWGGLGQGGFGKWGGGMNPWGMYGGLGGFNQPQLYGGNLGQSAPVPTSLNPVDSPQNIAPNQPVNVPWAGAPLDNILTSGPQLPGFGQAGFGIAGGQQGGGGNIPLTNPNGGGYFPQPGGNTGVMTPSPIGRQRRPPSVTDTSDMGTMGRLRQLLGSQMQLHGGGNVGQPNIGINAQLGGSNQLFSPQYGLARMGG